ncbi:hypothetical protein K8Y37_004666 [Salmonella enterica]|nr:hypothetical protein [Salmonella enterica]
MFFLYETYNFFYYLIKLIVIQPQYICVYMIFFFFNAGILQETEKRQELHESIPKTCKLKALDAQQGGLFGVDKDEWVFPDNKSFYLPEKYRPENRITELAMMKEG